MAKNQAYLFSIFTLVGILIGVLFDSFRVLRKSFKTNDIITYIEDIVFWIFTGIIIIFSMYQFCDGQLRFFMIMGIIIGTTIYMLTVSKYIIKLLLLIINVLKVIIIYPAKIIKKVIFSPVFFICINIKKIVKKRQKNRGFFIKKEKYNNI